MPLLEIRSNVSLDDARQDQLMQLATKTVAELVGKPESFVMIDLSLGRNMSFAASDAPTCFMRLASLGLPEQRTGDFSSRLCSLVGKQLGVSAERVYIEFSAPPRHLWGYNASTFG